MHRCFILAPRGHRSGWCRRAGLTCARVCGQALAAKDNGVPMYVALPSSTFDWVKRDGVADIPIELRGEGEVKYIQGLLEKEGAQGSVVEV